MTANSETARFKARVMLRSSRSDAPSDGAPSEREILILNPDRAKRICDAAGWMHLTPGTMNVEIIGENRDRVLTLDTVGAPLLVEKPEDVTYPQGPYRHIPATRGGWRYFRATIEHRGGGEPVLLRRPAKRHPHRPYHAELFAAVHLRERFGLENNSTILIAVEIPAAPAG